MPHYISFVPARFVPLHFYVCYSLSYQQPNMVRINMFFLMTSFILVLSEQMNLKVWEKVDFMEII